MKEISSTLSDVIFTVCNKIISNAKLDKTYRCRIINKIADDKYTVRKDSLNLRKYIVMPKEKFQPGYEYKLKVPHRKFRDINGFYNDSLEVKVSLPKDDKLSTMMLNMKDVGNKYIVDLLDERKTNVLRSYIIDKDQTLIFPYLRAGKYSIRITEDLNRNGLVDTGNILEHRQPEKVLFYKLENGESFIDIPEMTELRISMKS